MNSGGLQTCLLAGPPGGLLQGLIPVECQKIVSRCNLITNVIFYSQTIMKHFKKLQQHVAKHYQKVKENMMRNIIEKLKKT